MAIVAGSGPFPPNARGRNRLPVKLQHHHSVDARIVPLRTCSVGTFGSGCVTCHPATSASEVCTSHVRGAASPVDSCVGQAQVARRLSKSTVSMQPPLLQLAHERATRRLLQLRLPAAAAGLGAGTSEGHLATSPQGHAESVQVAATWTGRSTPHRPGLALQDEGLPTFLARRRPGPTCGAALPGPPRHRQGPLPPRQSGCGITGRTTKWFLTAGHNPRLSSPMSENPGGQPRVPPPGYETLRRCHSATGPRARMTTCRTSLKGSPPLENPHVRNSRTTRGPANCWQPHSD